MHENTTFCLIKNLGILHKSFFLDSNLRGLVRGLRGDSVYGYMQTELRILLLCSIENWSFGAAANKAIASREKLIFIVDVL